MEMYLERDPSTQNATIGNLFIAGARECYTLEDVVREVEGVPVEQWKIPKRTAIPFGRFRVVLSRSERFSRHASEKASAAAGHAVKVDVVLPEIQNVPGFTGVRMHGGNGPDDTDGCTCVGHLKVGPERIADCAPALQAVIHKIDTAIKGGDEVWLNVVKAGAAQGLTEAQSAG